VLFSAHSVPANAPEGQDPYPRQVAETARRIANALGLDDGRWQVVYQSAPRRTEQPWLGPDLADVVALQPSLVHSQLGPSTVPCVLVVPIGFVIDNLETLYDLDIELKEKAASLSIRLERAPALNERAALVRALAGAIKENSRRDHEPTI
jgi:ferrochelatase